MNARERGRLHIVPALLSLASIGWCAAILLAPLLEAGGHPGWGGLLRAALHPFCHQIPERSFAIDGIPLAVCARCTGIYAGFMAGCLAILSLSIVRISRLRPPGRALLLAAATPTAIEWIVELSGATSGSPAARSLAGALLGFTLAFYFLPALEEIGPEMRREYRRILSSILAHGENACRSKPISGSLR